jgi:hypothetical protein
MSEFKHEYFDAGPAVGVIDLADVNHAIGQADVRNAPRLRYSSPWPWALALALSITTWIFLGWLISKYL